MAEVELSNISHTFGDVVAVDDLSLRVEDGEFVVLLGPSGCGKSTTLRLIAGLESPDSGEIKIGRRVVNRDSAQRRDVAFVFQTYALYPHMTVADNMGFPLRMRDVPRAERREQVRRVAGPLGVEDLLGRYPGQLSGGQRQRVALGRAIVRDPAAFLLDEPLSNLDAQLRADMRVGLVRLQREIAGTFLFVTHDQVEAMTLADRVAIMRDGALQQFDTPDAIYREPVNTFVAQFVGSPRMNLLTGRLVRHGGEGTVFESRLLRLPVNGPAAAMPEGQEVVLGFRGADAELTSEGPGRLKVEVVEPLGSETYVYSSRGPMDLGSQLALRVPGHHRPREGDELRFDIPGEAIRWFHPETGDRLLPT
jgi:multiple sugar transport system ATP-binding protein